MTTENYILLIGYIATTLTTLATLPQIIRAFRTRDVSSVSLVTYVMLIISNMCWMTYGFLVRGDGKIDFPLVIGDAIALCLNAVMIVLKFIAIGKKKAENEIIKREVN